MTVPSPLLFLKATTKKQVWIEGYTKGDGSVVQGHYAHVHVSDNHDPAAILAGKGSAPQQTAHKKLSKEDWFHKLSDEHKVAHIQHHATQAKEAESKRTRANLFAKKLIAGEKPQPAEVNAAMTLPTDERAKLFQKITDSGKGAELEQYISGHPATETAAPVAEPPPAPVADPAPAAEHAPAPEPEATPVAEPSKASPALEKPTFTGEGEEHYDNVVAKLNATAESGGAEALDAYKEAHKTKKNGKPSMVWAGKTPNSKKLVAYFESLKQLVAITDMPAPTVEAAAPPVDDAKMIAEMDGVDDEPAHTAAPAGKDGVVDATSWKQVGPQMGSNPGGSFKSPDGTTYYIKTPDSEPIAKNEVLASKLYQMAGVPVAQAEMMTQHGKSVVATKWVDGLKIDPAGLKAPGSGAKDSFAVDAWLANWDVIGLGYDNLNVDKNGKAFHVDPGGALLYRAKGLPKGDAFGNSVGELDSFLKDNAQTKAIFGGITKAQIAESAKKVAALSPAEITKAVLDHGAGNLVQRNALAHKLIARRADLIAKTGIVDPYAPQETTPTAEVIEKNAGPSPKDGVKVGDLHIKQKDDGEWAAYQDRSQGAPLLGNVNPQGQQVAAACIIGGWPFPDEAAVIAKNDAVKEVIFGLAIAGGADSIAAINRLWPAAADNGPKEGDTKTLNGVTYILKGGRWHKLSAEQAAAPAASAAPPAVADAIAELKKKWKSLADSGNVDQVDKQLAHLATTGGSYSPGSPEAIEYANLMAEGKAIVDSAKPAAAPATEPAPAPKLTAKAAAKMAAAKAAVDAIPLPEFSPEVPWLSEKLTELKGAVLSQGASAMKGTILKGKHGKTIYKFKIGPYKVAKVSVYGGGAPGSNNQKVAQFMSAMKEAADSMPKVKATPAAPDASPEVVAVTGTSSGVIKTASGATITRIDGWKKTETGAFIDAGGKTWSVALSDDAAEIKKKNLHNKFDEMLGATLNTSKLVKLGDQLGIATKPSNFHQWMDPMLMDAVKGVSGMWLGGTEPSEEDKVALKAGARHFAKLKPEQIDALVRLLGPEDKAANEALATTLKERRAGLLAAFRVRDPWDVTPPDGTALSVNASDLPQPINFSMHPEKNGGPLSSVQLVNDRNTHDDAALLAFAAKGNLTALKNYQYEAFDKATGASLGMKPITDHPAKDIKKHWADAVEILTAIAYPSIKGLDMPPLGGGSLEEVSDAAGYLPPSATVQTVSSDKRLGFWMKLAQVDDLSEIVPKQKHWITDDFVKKAKAGFANLSNTTKAYIGAIQDSGWINHVFSQGQKTVEATGNGGSYKGSVSGLAAAAYKDAVEAPEGTQITRWMKASDDMVKQLLAEKPGLVFQNTDSMCCSYKKGWGDSSKFGSKILVNITYAKGAKALSSFASGHHSGEYEITTLPGSRFVLLGSKQGNPSNSTGCTIDVLMLPPHEGFVAELAGKE